MRWSQTFIPTLRDDPGDAEAVSHKLLVRAGFIRQLMAGSWSLMPPAVRVRQKIMGVLRQELEAIGAQEFLMPVLHPGALWQESGRWDAIGEELFRLRDRRDTDLCLSLTHEEVFTKVASELNSYKQLPQIWYHIQTKLRDEARPRSGLLRVREFTMKDSYTFDIDESGLDRAFDLHRDAYLRIFTRLGLDAMAVDASVGTMGGSGSTEFMVASPAGEDDVVICPTGDYAANIERADSTIPEVEDPAEVGPIESFVTPGVRTISDLATFDGGAPAQRQIKTLVYILDESPVLVLLRGDHELVEQKLVDGTGAVTVRPAHGEEIRELLGAGAGSLGAVGVSGVRIIADLRLQGRRGMTTGANQDDVHVRNVEVSRDIDVSEWVDLRAVAAGEPCQVCGTPLDMVQAIEVGHIFKLGTEYTSVMGVTVKDEAGDERPLVMGSYGIGVERALAAIVETHHDERGIVWPVPVAPWEVVITTIRGDDPVVAEAAQHVYDALLSRGVETLLDDRAERPGVKFADAELVGIPYRITIGPRSLESGHVEVADRKTGEQLEVALNEVVSEVAAFVEDAR